MAQDLERIKRRRETMRTSIDKLILKIEENINNDDVSLDLLEELHEQLSEKFSALQKLDLEVQNVIKLKDIEEEINTAEEFSDKIISWRCRLGKRIKFWNKQEFGKENITEKKIGHSLVASQQNIKLPKLSILPYFGDSAKWDNQHTNYAYIPFNHFKNEHILQKKM